MGKKMGVNEKVEAARDKKQAAKSAVKEKEEKSKEEAYWSAHDNPKGKKDVKREEAVSNFFLRFLSLSEVITCVSDRHDVV
jgi:fatty acid-binding protein DegV